MVIFRVQECARRIAAVHAGKAAATRGQALHHLEKAFVLCGRVGLIGLAVTVCHGKVCKDARGRKVGQVAGLFQLGHGPLHIVARGKAHAAHAGVHLEVHIQRDARVQGRIA